MVGTPAELLFFFFSHLRSRNWTFLAPTLTLSAEKDTCPYNDITLRNYVPLVFCAVLNHTAVPQTVVVVRSLVAALVFLVRRAESGHLVSLVPPVNTAVRSAFHAGDAAIVDTLSDFTIFFFLII